MTSAELENLVRLGQPKHGIGRREFKRKRYLD